MTVIGSALKSEVQKDVMEYDAVDDAIISAEQGATIILNYLEPARVFLYWRTKNMEVIAWMCVNLIRFNTVTFPCNVVKTLERRKPSCEFCLVTEKIARY